MTTKNSSPPPIPKHLYRHHWHEKETGRERAEPITPAYTGNTTPPAQKHQNHPREKRHRGGKTPKITREKMTRGGRVCTGLLSLSFCHLLTQKKKHHKTMRTWPKHRASKGMTTGKTVLCFPSHIPPPRGVLSREPRHARRPPTSRVYSSPVRYRPPRPIRQPAPTRYRPLKSPPSTASRSLPGEPGSRCRPRP